MRMFYILNDRGRWKLFLLKKPKTNYAVGAIHRIRNWKKALYNNKFEKCWLLKRNKHLGIFIHLFFCFLFESIDFLQIDRFFIRAVSSSNLNSSWKFWLFVFVLFSYFSYFLYFFLFLFFSSFLNVWKVFSFFVIYKSNIWIDNNFSHIFSFSLSFTFLFSFAQYFFVSNIIMREHSSFFISLPLLSLF